MNCTYQILKHHELYQKSVSVLFVICFELLETIKVIFANEWCGLSSLRTMIWGGGGGVLPFVLSLVKGNESYGHVYEKIIKAAPTVTGQQHPTFTFFTPVVQS